MMRNKTSPMKGWIGLAIALLLVMFAIFLTVKNFSGRTAKPDIIPSSSTSLDAKSLSDATRLAAVEREALKQRFTPLLEVNPETVAYIYAPGTMLDEPVVQTGDNATYLDKTFDGGYEPYMGTVFMDTDNRKDFTDRLTWLFGHARGSAVPDHRMFNDVNFYDKQDYFDQHKYLVVETPERKLYYEAVGLVIVPEETAFYRTTFADDEDFLTQLRNIYAIAQTKNPNIEIKASDRYLVLSTCREEDETIRSNLYMRQISEQELGSFLATHGADLEYVATR
ncbi:SrtB family sortase [Streptococcus azizii]|uniref:SrtB family sortase n=1 Tax=Streptococcus azizii TaxID=1579424 RepID=A0AB36JT43_9STRE|nr:MULTISPECIES: class B sortase, LPKTxAVK-specific [Streptococcus]MBF0775801.1 class B sortase [Streptococcus sp. 19428wD3_AN2]ONK29207.1 SrtB family sortase [Streptococcus azizii]ONK29753.1 SrtB family sortase [Streptococcus azizii]ONK30691.1 SrtB family sortase [Streptococcus azizii]